MLAIDARKRLGAFALDIAFEADARGVVALFGASGSGKTTTVDMIAGLARPDEGMISLDGAVLFESSTGSHVKPERRRIGYVFQDARLFPHMSVRRNLLYGRRFAPRAARRVALDDIVALLGLDRLLRRRPAGLSGGERQRVAIGRALLAEPALLLMDEPLASLDASRRNEILGYVERLRDDIGVPIVYVSHSIDEVARLAGTMVVLSEGRVAAVGSTADIMARLDLDPVVAGDDPSALLPVAVDGHDDAFALTALRLPGGGRLHVSRFDAPLGQRLHVRIKARDVAIATEEPRATSVLNVLQGRITDRAPMGQGAVDFAIDVGAPLRARITARSAHQLGLAPGDPVFALIKSVAIDSTRVGATSRLSGPTEPETLRQGATAKGRNSDGIGNANPTHRQ